MFDLQRNHSIIAEQYYKVLHSYHDKAQLSKFIQRWMDLLAMYSSQANFLYFEPSVPRLHRLVPQAVGLLIVSFSNTIVPHGLQGVSIIPLYPFRICYNLNTECSRDGMEMVRLYLQLTRVQLVGFYKISFAFQKLIPELQQDFPYLQIYGSSSFASFRSVCQRKKLALM